MPSSHYDESSFIRVFRRLNGLLAQEASSDKRLRHAANAFQEIMATPDKGIPEELLDKAQCIIIVPDLAETAAHKQNPASRTFAIEVASHGG